jgi:hypothetical protein
MHAQFLRLGLLLVVVASICLTAVISALIFRRQSMPSVALRRTVRLSWGLVTLGVAALAWGWLFEAEWLTERRVRVETPRLPVGTTYHLGLISDLHVDHQRRLFMHLVERLRDEPVDLLLFTGDSINEADGLEVYREILRSIPARLGRYMVRGNHDVNRWPHVDFTKGGTAVSATGPEPLLIDGGKLALCGADFGHPEGLAKCLRAAWPSFTIAAFHTPDLIESLEPRPSLYVGGHTHGGQIALPFYGAVITFSAFDKKYEGGVYEVNGTTAIITRGVGTEPRFPWLRLFAPPELVRIEVVGTAPVAPAGPAR